MADGTLDPAPVWDDVATFDPCPWAGSVDLIVAGFPCQPHSVAGKQQGIADHRWPVWDDIIRIAKGCAARAVFLENVPGLLTSSGGASIARVRADLDSAGFAHQSACIVAASDVGASHQRKRLFILAHADSQRQSQRGWNEQNIWRRTGDQRQAMADAKVTRLEIGQPGSLQKQSRSQCGRAEYAPGPDADWSTINPRLWPATAEPAFRGMADGTARGLDIARADRLRMLGNGVVPGQAAIALMALMDALTTPA